MFIFCFPAAGRGRDQVDPTNIVVLIRKVTKVFMQMMLFTTAKSTNSLFTLIVHMHTHLQTKSIEVLWLQ